MLSLDVKGKETTFAVLLMTVDSQQRKMDTKDSCDPSSQKIKALTESHQRELFNNYGKDAEVQLSTTGDFWWAYGRIRFSFL